MAKNFGIKQKVESETNSQNAQIYAHVTNKNWKLCKQTKQQNSKQEYLQHK